MLFTTGVSAQYEWAIFGQMGIGRVYPQVQQISDRHVLVFGGSSNGGPTNACEILNVRTMDIVAGSAMASARASFASVKAPNGKVYAVSGWVRGSYVLTPQIEEYDPATDQWAVVGSLLEARFQHMAGMIDDHRILVVGGRDRDANVLGSCEIFDINTGQSVPAAGLPYISSEGRLVKLDDGRVVVLGGRSGGPGSFRSDGVYAFEPSANTWIRYAQLPASIYLPAACVHSSGSLLVAGGALSENSDGTFRASDAVTHVTASGIVEQIGTLGEPKIPQDIVELPDGRLISIGGWLGGNVPTKTCDYVDLDEGAVRPGPSLNVARASSGCIVVRDQNGMSVGVVLSIGGRASNGASPVVEFLRIGCDPAEGDVLQEQRHELIGNAMRSGSEIQLTPPQEFSRGAVWAREKVDMRAPFSTMFAFRITQGDDQGEVEPVPSDPGADGVVLVIQNQGADVIGNYGRGIGYDGIKRSIAVEFDTYHNPPIDDPNGNHVAIQSKGRGENTSAHATGATLAFNTLGLPIKSDGTVYYAYVTYMQGRMDVYVNTSPSFRAPVVSKYVDLDSLIGLDPNGTAWVGITSGTGRSFEQHDLVMWEINGCGQDSPVSVSDGPEPVAGRARDFAIVGDEVSLAGADGDRYVVDVIDVRGTVIWSATADASVVQLPAASIGTGWYLVRVSSSIGSSVQTWVVVR